jgi:sulfane dehydrogenase subunit SoxC
MSKPASRRRFLERGLALAGLSATAGSLNGQAPGSGSDAKPVQDMTLTYGERSRHANVLRQLNTEIPHTALHGDSHGLGARTPWSALTGTITPSALHYVSSHGNYPPDIDPREHRLVISGLVERPLQFTMDELKRLPSVSRIHYLECVANGTHRTGKTVDDMHGMMACSEWTGVPLSVLLKEAGVKNGANWVLPQGVDATKIATSLPMGKAMDDVLVAYGQNGEAVRPHQGYPLRLVVPGFQGKYHVKWLQYIRVVEGPYMTYWEKHHYVKGREARTADPLPFLGHMNGAGGEYLLEQGPASVITFPSGEQRLPGHGYYTITGLAWSGCGAVRRVEVSVDGGRTWKDAEIAEPPRPMALARFTFHWTWTGNEAVLQSRTTDDKGQVQPSWDNLRKFWGASGAPHNNSIQPWRVTSDGTVHNAL